MSARKHFLLTVAAAALAVATAFALRVAGTPWGAAATAPERLTIALSTHIAGASLLVAAERGLFAKHGLEIDLQRHALGKFAIAAALDGAADLALGAETPFMLKVLEGQPIVLLATVYASGHGAVIMARRDLGVAAPADLAGKRIGLPFGTSVDYFKDAFLAVHRVPSDGMRFVDLLPDDAYAALLEGRVEAIGTFPPQSRRLALALGNNAVTFAEPALHAVTFNLIADRAHALARPQAVRRLLAALAEATDWIKAHPAEAQAIASPALGLDAAETAAIWKLSEFSLSLSQSLIQTLEDESRWALRRGLGKARPAPDFLEHIDAEPLAAVRRDLVTLVR